MVNHSLILKQLSLSLKYSLSQEDARLLPFLALSFSALFSIKSLNFDFA